MNKYNKSVSTQAKLTKVATAVALVLSSQAFAQQVENDTEATQEDKAVERITVVGSNIKNAQVSEALAVSVIGAEEIGELGVESLDDLLQLIPENGQNFMSEAENISGGVNSARGDVGSYNLRNLGTGNTLILLNGRRMVNSATYQTEEVGGSFVPVNSANVNMIPVFGLDQVEVLRDGASAIYGADAVAGVVNHVVKSDFVGFNVSARYSDFENFSSPAQRLQIEWGQDFNDGRTNVSFFGGFYKRDRINSQDDERWADSDFRWRIPEGSPWAGDTRFRNDSANSLYGQFDLITRASGVGVNGTITDNAGEFETYPVGDPRCQYDINEYICGAVDGQGLYRYNLNADRDLRSKMDRTNLFLFVNHEFRNGVESFTEVSYYESNTNLRRHPTAPFSAVKLRVGAENYYNPLGPCGSPNRLPDELIPGVPCSGLELEIDNYRFAEIPRIVNNDGDSYRFLQGFRGVWGMWDWEGAFTHSKATKDDLTSNRVSNNLMAEALFDPTPNAYNPFSGGVNSNIERALIDVYRKSETELTMFDFKMANPAIYELPAGPVGFVAGVEYREESFKDDRDPRLDGTIVFTDYQGDTYPFVSDVVNSSPTPDSSGERDVTSLFTEFQIPVLETLDVQAAIRYEDFSDTISTTVGKVAFGWSPTDMFMLRGSWSEAFRAPNLVTINESIVARNNTRTDYACLYAAEFGGDPNQDELDCRNSIQRVAQGSDQLVPEESTNTNLGIVFNPIDDLTLTVDYWTIEKENTIGLFGEENHTLLDLVMRLENGLNNCDSATFNAAVERGEIDPGTAGFYEAAGICPAGTISQITDQYANLDTRELAGFDIGIYYTLDSEVGRFSFKYNGSFLEKFEQSAGGDAAVLVEAQESGVLPASFPVTGFADLIGRDGNQEQRHSARVSWRKNAYAASLTGNRIGSFYQSSLTLDDGTLYVIPAMTTYNATFDYTTLINEVDTRFRFGIVNLFDERAPLADGYFGFFSDAHRDYGRQFYLDVSARF
ncbi:TonB-dependent receptor [Pseudidiomarina atlantica]|jgi:outer membrane receptor protein involved in Fe transport|uniref:TonB-dependent receptor n=1 Tax=Pseudidiomarina atlantica TaxID=1517416 RepID=A0A094IP34_9GAMM|nr:TonB-dependent receptor [Pseudidiomarina atlantica]KFZ29440.1 TonB-dependent receptor [Pseudidiomarina atlantica]